MTPTLIGPPSRGYAPSSDDRLDAIGETALALLAEPPDELADLIAMVGRRPPAGTGTGWHGYPRLGPRLKAAAGLRGTGGGTRTLVQWALWRLAVAGRIELALTPVRGRPCGRIRFARLAPARAAVPVPTPSAHSWAVPRAHAEAVRA